MTDEHAFEELRLRNRSLEEQVRLLSAAAKFRFEDPGAVVSDDVVELARSGQTVEAVKRLRQETGAGLIAAKRVVDAVQSGS